MGDVQHDPAVTDQEAILRDRSANRTTYTPARINRSTRRTMSIPTPATPAMTPRVRAFIYGALGWIGVAAFLTFLGFAATPGAEIPAWLTVANAIINGANLVFFVAKDNTPSAD